jgi:transposase
VALKRSRSSSQSRGPYQTYLGAQYRRIAARRGANRAAVAVAHSIIVIAYYMLKRGEDYRDLGSNYFDERQHDQVKRRLMHRLEALGYSVQLTPDAA